MKSLKATYIFLVCVCLGFTSCEFLDTEPYQITPENSFRNEQEAYSFLTGIYSTLLQSSFYGNSYLFLVGGDDLGHYGGSGRTPYKSGLICNNANSSDADVTALWSTLYTGINRANLFLENIDAVPEIKDETRLQYKSEARFLRAFFYFTLVECWGDVPFTTASTQDSDEKDLPRTDKQQIYDFIASEMSGCANDLKSASELSYRPGRISKSTAWGILARVYLFRAGEHYRDNVSANPELQKEYYRQASRYAQMVLKEGHTLAPYYWSYFIDICSDQYNTTGNESIWEVEFAGNRSNDVRSEGRIGNIIGLNCWDYSSQANVLGKEDPGFSYGFIYATPKLLELYEENGDINRCNWSIAPFTYTRVDNSQPVSGRYFEYNKLAEVKKQYYDESFNYGEGNDVLKIGDREKTKNASDNNRNRVCAKYRREYENTRSTTIVKKSKNDTSINFPILRYSDVLLMIAEAENELNEKPNQLAYECINQVRERARRNKAGIEATPADLQGLDKDEFRKAVKDERAMELCFEYTRRFDLIRWGEYTERMNELAPVAQAGGSWTQGSAYVYTYFQISSAYNYFPIPASEIASNSQITSNNPGW